jgi:hypothetical protein
MSTFIYTNPTYQMTDDGLMLVETRWCVYEGPLWECKKGREQAKTLTNDEIAQEKALAAKQAAEQAAADKTIGTFETQGQPGQLSPAAAAQLAADNDNINRTYNGMRQTAFATMGARGFGNAPSGFGLAEQNAINQGQAQAGTGAFRNAQVNTQNLEDKALNARMGLSGQDMSGQTAAAGTGLQGAQAMNKMGSTLGDIAGGVAAIAPLAAAPFTGGASLAAYGLPKTGLSNPFAKLGTYGPSNYNYNVSDAGMTYKG